MTVDKVELRRLAEAATQGEWNRRRVFGQLNVQDENFMLGDDDAKYIAAANPSTVLALLDECEENEGAMSVWRRRTAQAETERDAALAERDEHREMSGCMDLLRRDLIEAGVIGDACPPLFMTEAILGYFGMMKSELDALKAQLSDIQRIAGGDDFPSMLRNVEEMRNDSYRLEFMLSKNRKVICERLPDDNFDIYVEGGFMGDKRYPGISYSGAWLGGIEIKREAIDAAMAHAKENGND